MIQIKWDQTNQRSEKRENYKFLIKNVYVRKTEKGRSGIRKIWREECMSGRDRRHGKSNGGKVAGACNEKAPRCKGTSAVDGEWEVGK